MNKTTRNVVIGGIFGLAAIGLIAKTSYGFGHEDGATEAMNSILKCPHLNEIFAEHSDDPTQDFRDQTRVRIIEECTDYKVIVEPLRGPYRPL